MRSLPKPLSEKLQRRAKDHALRILSPESSLTDFSSNDYLGFARSQRIFGEAHDFLLNLKISTNGATGSRLLSGNHDLYREAEKYISEFHQCESALIFNSGYDANLGLFSALPQKGDIILFDELCHASIRDGIRLSQARPVKFSHNDCEHLELLIIRSKEEAKTIYIATESVFSMDGDTPNLEQLSGLSQKYGCYLIVDEAHALGVFGTNGCGIVQDLDLHNKIFARVVTFGKGLGCHGAAVLGSEELKSYLVNFARSFIYTTGLPPHSLATTLTAYKHLHDDSNRQKLRDNISFFGQEKKRLGLSQIFVYGKSAIQSAIIPGNEKVRSVASKLQQKGFDVRAILSPTVPEGQERLRFCLHSYNTESEICEVLALLATFVSE